MILIVGGTGFIGGHLAEYFFKEREISKALFRKGSHLRILDQCGVQCLEADILERGSLHEPLDGVDTVYNLASPTPDHDAGDFVTVNTVGLQNLLEEAKEHGVQRFLHLSTLDVHGFQNRKTLDENSKPNPTHPYQWAKLEGEKVLAEFGKKNPQIKIRIIRAARAVGARDDTLVVPLLKMAESGKIVLPSSAGDAMSFSHPKDIAQALHKVASVDSNEAVYQTKSFDVRISDLAETIARSCGKSAEIKKQGLLSKSLLPSYTTEQIKAGLQLREQASWKSIGFLPAFDLGKVGEEVAKWYKDEPWITEETEK